MEDRTKIMLIEDHEEIRNGLEFILLNEQSFYCKSYKNAEVALDDFEQFQPKVVLMDINLPGINGIEATRTIKLKHPSVLIMMCTIYEDSDKIFGALKAGASGYLLKRYAGSTLLDAIKEMLHGGAPMSSEIARKVVDSFQPSNLANQDTDYRLTRRESEILDLLAQGFRNKEIADKLFLSANTIRTHIYNIYEKLHVQSRIEALNKTGRNTYKI
jgi:DNA-binding NarL/FixJ family response regulator